MEYFDNAYEDGSRRKSWDHVHKAETVKGEYLFKVKDDTVPDEETEKFFRELDDYLSCFAKPIYLKEGGRPRCLHCGDEFRFEWGLTHGEGHCVTCGWPARAYHKAVAPDGDPLFSGTTILQYMPDSEAEEKARLEECS